MYTGPRSQRKSLTWIRIFGKSMLYSPSVQQLSSPLRKRGRTMFEAFLVEFSAKFSQPNKRGFSYPSSPTRNMTAQEAQSLEVITESWSDDYITSLPCQPGSDYIISDLCLPQWISSRSTTKTLFLPPSCPYFSFDDL